MNADLKRKLAEVDGDSWPPDRATVHIADERGRPQKAKIGKALTPIPDNFSHDELQRWAESQAADHGADGMYVLKLMWEEDDEICDLSWQGRYAAKVLTPEMDDDGGDATQSPFARASAGAEAPRQPGHVDPWPPGMQPPAGYLPPHVGDAMAQAQKDSWSSPSGQALWIAFEAQRKTHEQMRELISDMRGMITPVIELARGVSEHTKQTARERERAEADRIASQQALLEFQQRQVAAQVEQAKSAEHHDIKTQLMQGGVQLLQSVPAMIAASRSGGGGQGGADPMFDIIARDATQGQVDEVLASPHWTPDAKMAFMAAIERAQARKQQPPPKSQPTGAQPTNGQPQKH